MYQEPGAIVRSYCWLQESCLMTAMEALLLSLQERGEDWVWSKGKRGTWGIRDHDGGGGEGWS